MSFRYWDPTMDDDLIDDRVAMNLLYVQANSDIDRGWVNADTEQHRRLAALQKKNSKKEVSTNSSFASDKSKRNLILYVANL